MYPIIENFLTKYTNILFLVLAIVFSGALYKTQDFQLDASSDTLILENDQDLKNYREVIKDYSSKDFLLITLTDENSIISNQNINFIKRLIDRISSLVWIDSVQSILDAPILKNNNQSLSDLASNQLTLTSEGIDLDQAQKEFIESPIFGELIISKDGKTTGIIAYIDSMHDIERAKNIKEIRSIMSEFSSDKITMHLGGVAMIANDTISYVKNDIVIFGLGIIIFIIFVLFMIFRNIKWILLCLSNCIFTLVLMIGVIATLNWKVTVISSNFISLMLILTLSMTIHIIVRYRNLLISNNTDTKIATIIKNMSEMIKPCLFTTLTTMFAFLTLYFSGIKPIMDFGLMMCVGLLITLLSSFIFLPTLMIKLDLKMPLEKNISVKNNSFFIKIINRSPNILLIVFFFIFIIGIYGITHLKVENSFVNYFKSDTEIYKGMKLIDDKLGGTTPLEIIIQFNEIPDNDDDLLDFDFEYDQSDYWFTKEKMDVIKEVHDYIDSFTFTGKVLSLASVIRVAEELNADKEFDNLELSVIYKKLPQNLKSQILDPYLSIDKNQARITVRLIDTNKELRRNEFLNEINSTFKEKYNTSNYTIRTTGILVLYNNMLQSLFKSQISSLGIVMVGILLMLVFLFRSWKLAVIGILPNLIACMAILGIMGLLGIPLDLMTITIAAITIGIAVDNCIHYIYRFKENYQATQDYDKTILICNQTVGLAIRNTSLTIIVGFSILVFSNFWPTIYFGIFTALAMLIALIGSLTILPILIKKTRVFT